MSLAGSRPVTFVMTRDRAVADAFYGGTLGLTSLPGDDYSSIYDLAGDRGARSYPVPASGARLGGA